MAVDLIANLITSDLRRQRDIAQQNADTQRLVARAAANVDTTRANLMPTESAASIALQRAQAALTGNQASVVIPESQARTNLLGTEAGLNIAQTGLVGQNTKIAEQQAVAAKRRNRLITPMARSLAAVMGTTSGYTLDDIVPDDEFNAR